MDQAVKCYFAGHPTPGLLLERFGNIARGLIMQDNSDDLYPDTPTLKLTAALKQEGSGSG